MPPDVPKLQIVLPSGARPISTPAVRALCANPKTQEFVLTGTRKRWIYDVLSRCPGSWGIHQHQASFGVSRTNEAREAIMFWKIVRKAPMSERGVLLTVLRQAVRDLNAALEAVYLDLRVSAEGGPDYTDEAVLALSDFEGSPAEVASRMTSFADLLRQSDTDSDADAASARD